MRGCDGSIRVVIALRHGKGMQSPNHDPGEVDFSSVLGMFSPQLLSKDSRQRGKVERISQQQGERFPVSNSQ